MSYELYEIVMKIVGPVHPTGDHNEDTSRLSNMTTLIDLLDDLLVDVRDAARCAARQEDSMRRIGTQARAFLDEIKEAS